MQIGQDVIYFTDNGASLHWAKILNRPIPNNVVIGIYPVNSDGSFMVRDGDSGGFVAQAATLAECLNPGDRFITLGQATDFGINLTDGTQVLSELL